MAEDEARARSDDEGAEDNNSSPEVPQTSGSKSVVMPCTSTTDSMGREFSEPVTFTYFTDEESNDSQDQTRYLTVTYTNEDTAEEIATATLIIKRKDDIDEFLPFVGALLRSMQDERIKVKLMEDISQILINAKTEEIQRTRYRF